MMNKKDEEKVFIDSFIVKNKRERTKEILSNKKKRSKILNDLYHFNDLEKKNILNISSKNQNYIDIYNILIKKGAPETCYIISSIKEIDGKKLDLFTILQRIIASAEGTLISCIPGKLGYYEGEHIKDRCILEKP